MKARILFSIVALALLFGGGYFVYRTFIFAGATEEAEILTIPVVTQSIEQTVNCIGEVEPSLFTDLKSEVSGRVEEVHVESGDRVEAGDVLIELDRSELETQIIEASLAIEKSALEVEKAKLDFDSKKQVFDDGFLADKEFKDADIDYRLAQNELNIQKAKLQLLEDKLTKTTISAPHSGVILDNTLTPGMVITGASSVSNGDVLMRVAQLNDLLVETTISEVDVSKVRNQMPVTLTFDSLPGLETVGEIIFISPSAQPKQKDTPTSARVFPITVAFAAENPRIRPGMTAQVIIVLDAVQNALAAELPGFFLEDGQNIAYVKGAGEDNYDRREVTLGINDNSFVEIKSGLNEGDQIATTRPAGFEAKPPVESLQKQSRT